MRVTHSPSRSVVTSGIMKMVRAPRLLWANGCSRAFTRPIRPFGLLGSDAYDTVRSPSVGRMAPSPLTTSDVGEPAVPFSAGTSSDEATEIPDPDVETPEKALCSFLRHFARERSARRMASDMGVMRMTAIKLKIPT